jgi:sugar phosphate isomerase/epimerase
MTGVTRIGLALYTVRDDTARDLEGTLHAVAGIGYEGVELHGLDRHDAAQVRGWLDDAGLAVSSRHASLEAIETDLPGLAAEARAIGWRRLVLAWLDPSTLEDRSWPPRLGRAADAAAAHGLELGFHNHDAEVRSGFLERLPAQLFVEVDLGWAWWAGADPVEVLDRLPGRVPLVHVKDFRDRGRDPGSFAPVGDGVIDYERVAPAAVAAGADWLLVEQDHCEGPALQAAARSFAALTRMAGTA